MQDALVALIVAACFGYAVWVLMPAVMRRGLAQRALALPWPQPVATRLKKAAQGATGCACDGCDNSGKPAAKTGNGQGGAQPIRIHRTPPR
jgi:hypothetical protein